jgi:hypothetical protein
VRNRVLEVRGASDSDEFPKELSFFHPHLQFFVKEISAIGGEAKVSLAPSGEVSGLFIYDNYEETGSIFTRSSEVFDYFYGLKPSFVSLFSEFNKNKEEKKKKKLTYDIVSMDDVANARTDYDFRHPVSITTDVDEVESFMLNVHPSMNPKWVKNAMKDDGYYKCFTVKVEGEIVGMSWLALVNRVGWMPDLYVRSQFRRMRIARDLFYARLLYLKLRRARSYYAEIAQDNKAALDHALQVGLKVSRNAFYYFKQDSAPLENPLNEVSSLD